MPTLSDFPPWMLRVFVCLFGLAWGSFLNVVIHRVPREQSVARPSSRCPHCGKPIPPQYNIPLISWIVLRGRARCCGARISPRYAIIEAAGGLLALAVLETVIFVLPADAGILKASAVFIASFALCLGLVAAAFIDLEHMYIPDSISFGCTLLGIATFSFRPPLELSEVLLSSLGAFLFVWLVFGVLYRQLRGRTGMGLGDAKLLMVAGAWFGWRGAVFVLVAGAVQGTMAAIVLLLTRGKLEDPEAVRKERQEILAEIESMEDPSERAEAERLLARDPLFEKSNGSIGQARLPFGPFLSLSIIEYLLIGPTFLDQVLPWLILS